MSKILLSSQNMKTYCLSCKKYTDNIGSRNMIMTNKVIRQASKCVNCVAEKSRFLKQKPNRKTLARARKSFIY